MLRRDVAHATTTPEPPKKTKLDLNAPTLVAGAGATVTMSVLGSYLGTVGTLTGAAITSVASAVVTAVYKHTATVAQERAKRVALQKLTARHRGEAQLNETERTQLVQARQEALDAHQAARRWNPRRLAVVGSAVAAGLFGGVMLVETGAEALAGKPVAAIVQGKPGHGTSLGGGRVLPATPTPTGTGTPTVSGSAVPTQPGQRSPLVTPSTPPGGVQVPAPPTLPLTSPPTVPSQNAPTAPPQGGSVPSGE
jgi:hypothetical protein